MHDAQDTASSGLANDRAGVVLRVSRMNDDRLLHLTGECDLRRERGALDFARGIVVVVVESALADRNGGVPEQLAEAGNVARRVKRRPVVRMNSCRREDKAGVVGRDLGGNRGRRKRFPDADDRPRAPAAGARDYRVAVAGEGRVREVGVAVDED